MIAIGKIENRELSVTLKGVNVIDLRGLNGVVVPAGMEVLAVDFYLYLILLLGLIPTYSPIWASTIARSIHVVLAFGGNTQIFETIIESLFSVYVIALAGISKVESKDLPVHIDSFATAGGSTCIPSRTASSFAFPSKPSELGNFGVFVRVNDGNLILRQLDDSVFRCTHVSRISDLRGASTCQYM